MKQSLAIDLVDSLPSHIAVLDTDGNIVAVNKQWKRFAMENGGDNKSFYVGTNYLDICKNALRHGESEFPEAVLQGFHDLIEGKKEEFSIEYPCHSPTQKHWFIANIKRFLHEGVTYLLASHEEITTRKLAEDRLHETETTLRNILETLPVGVWFINREGKIIHGNPAGKEIWAGARYVGPEQFGEYKAWWLDSGRRIEADEWAAARAIKKGETSINEEILIECFDGSRKIILNSALPLRDAAGNITGAIIVNQDITSRKHAEDELLRANKAIDAMNRELQAVLAREQHKARTDDLTGLNNRRQFFEVSEKLFSVAKRYNSDFSILLFDIDEFKQVNDTYGHQAGDVVLKSIAQIAQENTRDSDILARYGGEEFIIALPNTNASGAFRLAENIRSKVEKFRQKIDGNEVNLTISVGVVEMTADDKHLDRLIQFADQALYTAKSEGRNRSCIFKPAT